MKATCSGCPAEWTGLVVAHCGNCHETFSTPRHFDSHRSPRGERGACLDPNGLKRRREGKDTWQPLLRLDKRGIWVDYRTRPEELNHSE